MKQKIIFGNGKINEIPGLIDERIVKRIFLVTGKRSFELSGAKKKTEIIKNNFQTFHYETTGEYPKIEEIVKGIRYFNESDIDLVLAVGGGNVIDTAKSINILAAHSDEPEDIISGKKKISFKGKELIAVPTTAGSGSESTHFAVVYSGIHKFSIADEFILPDTAVIDPKLTYSLDSKTTAVTGIDAFSQALESYWAVGSTSESRKYSAEAIELILKFLPKSVNEPDEESRENMCRASNLAGRAINIAKTTAPHALSYAMTSHFGISHGQAVCVTLPEFLEFNYGLSDGNKADRLEIENYFSEMKELTELFGCKDIPEVKIKIREFIKSIGLKTTLSELGIKNSEDLNIILKNVNAERLGNNPRKISAAEMEKILQKILI
ncbi:MAG: phosphonoacetaldehyde reductase [Bacteroidetes bacterium]|nr:phosphonoacetaldehyde reductase [Bacteroidota bacterium]